MKLARRTVLKGVAGLSAVPLAQLVLGPLARAQGAMVKRFIGVYHPHGIASRCYDRQASETETTYDLGFTDSALSPFDSPSLYGGRSFKNRITTFQGVDLAVAETSGTAGHGAAIALFTGSIGGGADHSAQNESIDQFLARTHGLGSGTAFPTLNLGVGSTGDANQDSIAHGPGGAQILNQVDPQVVFDRVFASLLGGADGGTSAAAARARGKSVVDFVRGDLSTLKNRLATTEKLKLDQHLTALREIEARLESTNTTTTSCRVPARPTKTGNVDTALDFPKVLKWNGGEPYFDRIADLQVDLLAVALSCDLTRFATVFFDDPGKVMTVDGTSLPRDVHNEVAHTYSPTDSASVVKLGRLNRYYYGKIARLLQRLDEYGLIDSTLVMAGSDMGNPSLHSTRNIPLLLAGGLPGLTLGRRIVAPNDCPPSNQWCTSPTLTLTPHNKVLVSICNLFGVQTTTFGSGPANLITGSWQGL